MVARDCVAKDFEFLKDRVKAILIFGSSVGGEGRDIDVCVVAGEKDPKEILKEIFLNVNVEKYDVWIFEELPLYMKIEVIENHKIVYCKDVADLYEYFYKFRKIWKDQEHRNKLSRDEILSMLK